MGRRADAHVSYTVSLHHLRAWQGMHCHFEQEGPPEVVTMIELLQEVFLSMEI